MQCKQKVEMLFRLHPFLSYNLLHRLNVHYEPKKERERYQRGTSGEHILSAYVHMR